MKNELNLALVMAAREGLTDVAKSLVAAGADVQFRESAPLRQAVKNGHADMVKLLRRSGADIGPAILAAANNGDINEVRTLMGAAPELMLVQTLQAAVWRGPLRPTQHGKKNIQPEPAKTLP